MNFSKSKLNLFIKRESGLQILNLNSLEPASNYRLVMKATQLDLCATNLSQCFEQREHLNYDVKLFKMVITLILILRNIVNNK